MAAVPAAVPTPRPSPRPNHRLEHYHLRPSLPSAHHPHHLECVAGARLEHRVANHDAARSDGGAQGVVALDCHRVVTTARHPAPQAARAGRCESGAVIFPASNDIGALMTASCACQKPLRAVATEQPPRAAAAEQPPWSGNRACVVVPSSHLKGMRLFCLHGCTCIYIFFSPDSLQ